MFINTQTNQYPVTELDIRSAFPNTSFPVPFVPPENYALVFPSPQPTFNPVTQRVQEIAPMLTVKGHYEQQWEVQDLPQEQVATNLVTKAEADARLIQSKIEALWAAADKYTSSYISGVAIGLLTIGVIQQKPKALAIKAWSSSIWAEYYNRKSTVTVESIDNHDFSIFGPIPYTVPELEAEVGA